MSGSSAAASISAPSAISTSAWRKPSLSSTIGPSSAYSFDNLANSAPPSPAADNAAPSSACRRTSWSKRDSRTRSISELDDRGEGRDNGNCDGPHAYRQPHLQFLHLGPQLRPQLVYLPLQLIA